MNYAVQWGEGVAGGEEIHSSCSAILQLQVEISFTFLYAFLFDGKNRKPFEDPLLKHARSARNQRTTLVIKMLAGVDPDMNLRECTLDIDVNKCYENLCHHKY